MMEIYDMAGHLIRRLNQISVAIFTDRMTREGLDLTPVQFGALTVIDAEPGVDQATLSGAIAYDRATIGGVVDRLEQKELIRREVSRRDRRARILSLTEAGKRVLEAARPIVWELQGDILAGLTPAEQKQFLALAKKAADSANTLARAPLAEERVTADPAAANGHANTR